jgi:hypothetical protein
VLEPSEKKVATIDVLRDTFNHCTGIFIASCMCREDVNLFRFPLSPCALIGTCNSIQNCTFCGTAEVVVRVTLHTIVLGDRPSTRILIFRAIMSFLEIIIIIIIIIISIKENYT